MCTLFRQISCKISIGFMSIGPKLGRYYTAAMVVYLMAAVCTVSPWAGPCSSAIWCSRPCVLWPPA